MAYKQCFHHPSKKVGEGKYINMGPDPLHSDVRTVNSIFFVHINMKILQTWVCPYQNTPDSSIVLEEEKLQHQFNKYNNIILTWIVRTIKIPEVKQGKTRKGQTPSSKQQDEAE